MAIGSVLTLARFSEAFLILKAQQSGVAMALVPLAMVVMNLLYAMSAYPFGRLSDRMSQKTLLALGLVVLIAVMASNTVPADLRGSAFGFIHLTSGLAMLVASVLPGLSWDHMGSSWTFYGGAIISSLALAGLVLQPAWRTESA